MSAARKNAHLALWLLTLAGAGLLAFLLARNGVREVAHTVIAAGWGVLAVVAFHAVPLFADTLSWWNLFPKANRPGVAITCWMRWVGESVSFLLPTSAIGGDFLRARLASLRGVPAGISGASVLADITLGIFVQAFFTLLGVSLLIAATGQTSLLRPLVGGALLAAAAFGGFFAVQRYGMFHILEALVKRFAKDPGWHALFARGGGIDTALRGIYGSRRSVVGCCLSTVCAWLASSCEVWIAMHALGLHIGFEKAVILESISQGVRAVMFFIPGALGVQELGYVGVGKLIGIDYNTAVALSMIRRARELAFGIPGLLSWQFSEGKRLLMRREVQTAE